MRADKAKLHRYISVSAQIIFIATVFCIQVHLLSERIDQKTVPYGDEGSWLSVATEVARGNGFTTRWLEYPFLKPYSIPRPDDFRFPALTLLLAAAFRIFGVSYTTGLWVIASISLIFNLLIYFSVKKIYGKPTALTVYTLTVFSLLQLMYSTEIYTEVLFGTILALIILVSTKVDNSKLKWWTVIGLLTGVLYLVRPNAILFIPALCLYFLLIRKKRQISYKYFLISTAIFLAVISPWLIRNYLNFGNPFHVAGSGGLLRAGNSDPATLSLSEFVNLHGIHFFLTSILQGLPQFFKNLNSLEHGSNIIPLLLCLIAAFRKHPFYNGFITCSFVFTFLACAYTARLYGWAGVRYFSPFLPFVYAYGISYFFRETGSLIERFSGDNSYYIRLCGIPAIILLLGIPLINPHRYYERVYKVKPVDSTPEYYSELSRQISGSDIYYAGRLAQLNFATNLRCVGIQSLFGANDMITAQKHFNPALLVLTRKEFDSPRFKGLLDTLGLNGYQWSVVSENEVALYIRITN